MKKATGEKRRRKSWRHRLPSMIDARIKELGDWRGETLARVRAIIKQADPDVVEEWKWRGVPVWEHDGIICTGETYKAVVKMTFAKGAALDGPVGPLQLQPRRQRPARHRYPRGRQDRREGVEGAHPRRRGAERFGAPREKEEYSEVKIAPCPGRGAA